MNSTFVAFVVTLTGVALASTAGYAFSRFNFIGKKIGLLSLLVTQMFPATMLLLPMYIMLVKLHLINSYLGIIIMYSATALPFCVWQMKGYYDTIPTSLEEAGRIDGCNRFQTFYQIILPLASPALVITALFSFMSAWTEYIVAAQILQDTQMWTLPLRVEVVRIEHGIRVGALRRGFNDRHDSCCRFIPLVEQMACLRLDSRER